MTIIGETPCIIGQNHYHDYWNTLYIIVAAVLTVNLNTARDNCCDEELPNQLQRLILCHLYHHHHHIQYCHQEDCQVIDQSNHVKLCMLEE